VQAVAVEILILFHLLELAVAVAQAVVVLGKEVALLEVER
jgi:hypothetical protein